jgi:hypothetical protein
MAVRYFRGFTDSNWNLAANWAQTFGGPGGFSVHTATSNDDVFFDASSPNCTVNAVSLGAKNLNFTGYTGTIGMANALLVGQSTNIAPVTGSLILSATMGITGSGAIITRNNTFTMTSNGKVWPNDFTILAFDPQNVSGTAFILTDNLEVNGQVTIGGGLNTTAISINGAFSIICNGSLYVNKPNPIASTGPTKIIFRGAGSWTHLSPVGRLELDVDIDTGANTLSIGTASIGAQGSPITLRYLSGTVDCTGGTFYMSINAITVNVNGSSSPSATVVNSSGVNFNNLVMYSQVNNPSASTLTSPICVVGNFEHGYAGITFGLLGGSILNSSFLYLNGNITMRGRSLTGSTQIVYQGTGTWSDAAPQGLFSQGLGLSLDINTTGTFTVSGSVNRSGGTLKYTAGTVITTGSTLIIERSAAIIDTQGMTWDNIQPVALGNVNSAVTVTFVGNNTFLGNFSTPKTGAALTLNGGRLKIGGNFSAPSLSTSGQITGTTVLEFNGAGTFSINPASYVIGTTTGTGIRNNIDFNNGANTFTLNSFRFAPSNTGFTYTSGNIDASSCTLDVLQVGTLLMNTFGMTWSTITTRANGNLLTTLNSKLVLSGTLNLNVFGGVYTFGGTGGFEVANFVTQLPDAAGRTIFFSQTATEFKINNSLTMVGTAAFPRPLQNQSGLTRAIFTLASSATQNVYYVNATRIDSGLGQTIWSFGATLVSTINWNVGGNPGTSAITYVN